MYAQIKASARHAILANIEREREGDQVDRALLKNTLEIFQEVQPVPFRLLTSSAGAGFV